MADDASEGVRRPGRRVPENEAAEHFDVKNAERPILDEMNNMSLRWGSKVGVQRNDDVHLDKQGKEGGKQECKGDVCVEEPHETDTVLCGVS